MCSFVQAIVQLREVTPKEAQGEIHETLYEYQEWSVLSDWQPMASPGRYRNYERCLAQCVGVVV